MPRLTIDGKEIEVEAGTNLIEAARRLGVEVPHYCYHPGLSIAGQCRLCMVDIEKTPRPTIACNTLAADGMVVLTETERVKETRRSIMEFHLINHPLDCPVCDQAGECWLQIYYMQHGLYDPRMRDEKVHKPKAVPLRVQHDVRAERHGHPLVHLLVPHPRVVEAVLHVVDLEPALARLVAHRTVERVVDQVELHDRLARLLDAVGLGQ